MSKPNRATQAKRNRERANQEKQEDKRARKALKKEQKKLGSSDPSSMDEDPDLAEAILVMNLSKDQ